MYIDYFRMEPDPIIEDPVQECPECGESMDYRPESLCFYCECCEQRVNMDHTYIRPDDMEQYSYGY